MNKVFLSHSSKDKEYVSYIANCFGRDHCVYDSMCFEAGMKNLDEIFREMDRSCIFVVFLSNSSLDSEWVKKELSIADEKLNYDRQKLSQIFPIIIDPLVSHLDDRIPDFLRKGFGSYNLRVITSNKVAYRKIKAQQVKYLIDNHLFSPSEKECFYGRDEEIACFKKAFDSGNGIKCIISSGFSGIGRKSYLLQCLKRSQIIEDYYSPPIVSLDHMSSIEDLIIKLSEVGFGNYSIDTVSALASIEQKIDVLVEVLKSIQDYREQVIIYDNGCLVSRTGAIVYWLEKALEQIRPEVTLIIAAQNDVNIYELRRYSYIFSRPLSTLPYHEWMGLMRVYAQTLNLELSQEDREYFRDILTGYPPQVKYCVELIKDTSIYEVKQNPHPIVENFSQKTTEMLDSAIPKDIREDAFGLLAFIAQYGIVPTSLLSEILKAKETYRQAFSLFKTLTICRTLGISNEYVEVNPLVSDFIQRGRFEPSSDIKHMLKTRVIEFNKSIDNVEKTDTEDFESIKYYLKTNIIEGKDIPARFMYATVYLSSIYELYNHQRYKQVISLVEKLKNMRVFQRYDLPVQTKIQGYYCRALARETNPKFYEEVEFFNPSISSTGDYKEYNFLRGFMFRHNSEYDKALDRYKLVLARQSDHRSAMREIVTVYRGLEDYESAYEYARSNYQRDPENPYQIQPYFEILARKSSRTESENKSIEEMLRTIQRISYDNSNTTYYEIRAQYAAYITGEKEEALSIIHEGAKQFPDSSYILRTWFDCSEHFKDLEEMQESLRIMEPLSKNSKSIKVAFSIRRSILYAYEKKPRDFIFNTINDISGLNADAKERIKKRIKTILN